MSEKLPESKRMMAGHHSMKRYQEVPKKVIVAMKKVYTLLDDGVPERG